MRRNEVTSGQTLFIITEFLIHMCQNELFKKSLQMIFSSKIFQNLYIYIYIIRILNHIFFLLKNLLCYLVALETCVI